MFIRSGCERRCVLEALRRNLGALGLRLISLRHRFVGERSVLCSIHPFLQGDSTKKKGSTDNTHENEATDGDTSDACSVTRPIIWSVVLAHISGLPSTIAATKPLSGTTGKRTSWDFGCGAFIFRNKLRLATVRATAGDANPLVLLLIDMIVLFHVGAESRSRANQQCSKQEGTEDGCA